MSVPLVEFYNIKRSTSLLKFAMKLEDVLELKSTDARNLTGIVQNESDLTSTKSVLVRFNNKHYLNRLKHSINKPDDQKIIFEGRTIRFKMLPNSFLNVAQLNKKSDKFVIEFPIARWSILSITKYLSKCNKHDHLKEIITLSRSRKKIFIELGSAIALNELKKCKLMSQTRVTKSDSFTFIDEHREYKEESTTRQSVFQRLYPPLEVPIKYI